MAVHNDAADSTNDEKEKNTDNGRRHQQTQQLKIDGISFMNFLLQIGTPFPIRSLYIVDFWDPAQSLLSIF